MSQEFTEMTPEKRVQNAILSYFKSLQESHEPLYYAKRQAGGFSYRKGLPDITGSYKGYHFEIEVKRPGGSRTSMQEKWETIFRSIGVRYLVADNVQVVKDFFKAQF